MKTHTYLPFVTGMAYNADLNAEQGLYRAHLTGCSHWYIDGSLDSEHPENWPDERIETLRLISEARHIKPIFHGNYKAPLSSEIEQVRKGAIGYVKSEIDLCANLKSPLIIHGGAIIEARFVKQAKAIALQNLYRSLLELSRYARDKGVELWLENLSNFTKQRPFHYIFSTPAEFKFIFEQVPDLKFLLNVGHANIGNDDPFAGFAAYHDRIVALSLSNNDGEKDHHFPLPYGSMSYAPLLKMIENTGWRGLLVFETHGRDPDRSLKDLEMLYGQPTRQIEPELRGPQLVVS